MVCKRRIFRIYTEMNKKINVLSFTKKGSQKNKELCSYLTEQENICLYGLGKNGGKKILFLLVQ